MGKNSQTIEKLANTFDELKRLIDVVPQLSELEFEEFAEIYHNFHNDLKDSVYISNKNNKNDREKFEYEWGAQSIQFLIDSIPEIHHILLKYYKRADELTLLDVGAGSAAGSNLIALLHAGRTVYSKIKVDAIDCTPLRKRWVKIQYPLVNYSVANLFDLPSKSWDFTICSHVIEHVPNPKKFIQELERVCKGFAFIYAPYQEIDRIPGHINTITEELFGDFKVESTKILKSMAWHADIAEDKCIFVTLDCRNSTD